MPGGQAEYLRVPQADYGPIKVPEGPPDDRFLFLSDVLPTAWQAVEYADVPEGGTLARDRARARSARWPPAIGRTAATAVIAVDLVPAAAARGAAAHGVETLDLDATMDESPTPCAS